jgi:2-polyprenyl-3-methyl-5-hydroxy-6-metoxy-1,4-benzoquinol methylase
VNGLFELEFDPAWKLDRRFFLDVEHRYTKTHRILLAASGDLAGKRILDLGCSRGMLLERFRRYDGVELVGVELDPADRAEAEARGIHVDQFQINVFDESGQITARLPYDDESFDVVLAAEIIEHIVDTEGFVREIHRILRPNGAVFLSTPNILWWKYRLDALRGRYPDPLEHKLHYGTDFGHVRIFTPALLRELVEDAGFEVVGVAGKRLGPISTLTRPPRRVAGLLDALASRNPDLADDVLLSARKRQSLAPPQQREVTGLQEDGVRG